MFRISIIGRSLRHTQFGQHLQHVGLLGLAFVMGGVADMGDHVGLQHLFQRGAERGDQFVGRSAMKPTVSDRITLRAVRQLHAPHGGIERGEQQVLGQHLGIRSGG